ncbi:MAG: hypothetical protein M1830_005377 [Pleopsidium flavum]|nr:MAG: hypothetical protein M1830_005377 [Pleopsidium flavum]
MASPESIHLAKAFSRLLGWTYFLCWSASFYPQPILNYRRRSTHGLAIDFPTINVFGFVSYAISTSTFLFAPLIRLQYAARNPLSPDPTVRFNDLAFAAHAVVMSSLAYSQFWGGLWGFTVGKRQRVSMPVAGIFWGSLVAVSGVVLTVVGKGRDGGRDASGWAWIDVIYSIGFVKLVVTVVKYIPQVWVNYKRQSTVGWSINQILLDISGGVLSLLQLVIDSSLQDDWSGLTGNPVKLGLGNISIFFDVVFILQHYWLYRRAGKVKEDAQEDGSERPLLGQAYEEASTR